MWIVLVFVYYQEFDVPNATRHDGYVSGKVVEKAVIVELLLWNKIDA